MELKSKNTIKERAFWMLISTIKDKSAVHKVLNVISLSSDNNVIPSINGEKLSKTLVANYCAQNFLIPF